jgi:hypothetical protein
MLYQQSSTVIAILLGVVMILLFMAGKGLKRRRIKKTITDNDGGLGPVEGSLLGLLALLLSFTFGMSSTRYDNRSQVLVHEANTIGTAILRTDLFPDSVRANLRSELRQYLDSRIDMYDAGNDFKLTKAANFRGSVAGDSLWQTAVGFARSADFVKRNSGSLMVSALNEMFDAATSRRASREETIPDSIIWLLFLLCFASAFIVGYGAKQRVDWVMVTGFAAMVSITVFAILDLDRPYRGLITLDKAESTIIELRSMFGKFKN